MSTAATQKPFVLYTGKTPNGYQPSILLEELKAVYGSTIDYEVRKLDFSKTEQKEPWFLEINPNGRIPALVDHSRGDFKVFETAAILLYLEQHYDPERKFTFDPQSDEYSEMLQWIFFTHGGVAPMMGQGYLEETKRLFGVLQIRLENRKYLAGAGEGSFSIADIKAVPWVKMHAYIGIESLDQWPGVKAWIDRVVARPGVQAGLQVPQ
ncbi:hypothetical protein HWV62_3745 [Athelia sp. TMB]|nr:hypothetical protein HWV62_3745 [Athelia sp. TMB]